MKKYIPIFIIIFFIITPFSSNIITNASSSISNIIYVDDDGEAEYKKIQEAINIANDGDIIFVNKGIYQENIFINKSITLTGENKNNTYIIGNHINDVINISNQGVIVSDFTIQNSGKSGRDAGIKILSNNVNIFNNNIINNTIGVFIEFSNDCNIQYNFIHSNKDSGIHILSSYEIIILSNEIYNNRWGIFSVSSINNTIEKNDIYSNKLYGIWLLRGCFGNTIQHNTLYMNNEYGICLNLFSGYNVIYNNSISYSNYCGINIGNYWPCDGNSIIENKIYQNLNLGIFIQDSSENLISRNNFINNTIDASFNNCYDNIWEYNYWNESRNFPKAIQGKFNMIPWLNFDWHPETQPHNISKNIKYLDYNNKKFKLNEKNNENLNLPSIFSWRDINGVDFTPPIKNQNPAPTCEAYALCASIETVVQYQVGYPFGCDLSEAHLFFLSGGTCDWGVDIQKTVEYLIEQGVPDEGSYPDPHRPYDSLYESVSDWENRTIKIKEWGWVNNDIESIKQALIKYGPLVICQMTRKDLDNYNNGIYMPKISSPIQRGHVVTIIGYDDNQRCFTIRNSGGDNWGEKGYFRISYDGFNSYYSFIYPFYGGTGILYIDGVYGNLMPDVPKIEIITPKIYHTYLLNNEIKTIFKRVSTIQRAAPRIFGELTINVDTLNTNMVEFLLDGVVQHIDEDVPFKWDCKTSKGLQTIEVIAHNDKSISKDIIDVFVVI